MAYGGASTVYEASGVGSSSTLSITGIPANSTVVVAVSVLHGTVNTGDLVSSVSSSPALGTAFAVPTGGKAHRTPDDNAAGRQGIYFFVGRTGGSAADHTFTITYANASGNLVKAQAVYWTGQASSPVDQATSGSAGTAASSIAAGPLTPAQANEDILAFVAGKWWYDFGSTPAGAGFTQISTSTDNNTGKLPHWLGRASISAVAAQSASWNVPPGQGDGGLALLLLLKVGATGTKKLKAQFKASSGINGVTNLLCDAWKGNSNTNYSQTLGPVNAEATGDVAYFPAPTGAGADGEQWEIVVYKTGFSSDRGIGTIVTV